MVLGIQPRTSHVLRKRSITGLSHESPMFINSTCTVFWGQSQRVFVPGIQLIFCCPSLPRSQTAVSLIAKGVALLISSVESHLKMGSGSKVSAVKRQCSSMGCPRKSVLLFRPPIVPCYLSFISVEPKIERLIGQGHSPVEKRRRKSFSFQNINCICTFNRCVYITC